MSEYQAQLQKGLIQQAYRGLMDFMSGLRARLQDKYPGYQVSGSLYPGVMDMTYFSFTPPALAAKKLKIAIVYLHEAGRFEAWLAGVNKQVQANTWQALRGKAWGRYRLATPAPGVDAILEHTLAENPDFSDPGRLAGEIEAEALAFIRDVEPHL